MIQIVEIVKVNQKKFKVKTDHKGIAFVVYKGDLLKYGFVKDAKIPKEYIDRFYGEVLLPRAKRRGMYLLEAREYSVMLLAEKLRTDGYPECVIAEVVEYLQKYRYLDDDRYTKAYIRTYAGGKSLKEIKRVLRTKGISEEHIESALKELQQDELPDEKYLIERYLIKRKYNPKEASIQERNKMFQYLRSKGFDCDMIASFIKIEV